MYEYCCNMLNKIMSLYESVRLALGAATADDVLPAADINAR